MCNPNNHLSWLHSFQHNKVHKNQTSVLSCLGICVKSLKKMYYQEKLTNHQLFYPEIVPYILQQVLEIHFSNF